MTICAHGVKLLIIFSCVAGDLQFPATPGVIYSAVRQNVSIPCEHKVGEEGPLLVIWYFNESYKVSKDAGVVKYRDPTIEKKYNILAENFTLVVYNVQTEDTGHYRCERSYRKLVDGLPKLVQESETLELIVQDLENETIFYEIEHDANITLTTDEYVTSSPDNISPSSGDNTSSPDNISPSSGDNTSVSTDVPSPPGVPSWSNVKSREAVVSWQKSYRDNNSPITNYIINVKKVVDKDWSESRVLLVDGDTISIIVRELLPYTAYQIRVIAKNAMGNSEPSSPSSIFYTEPEVPTSPPLNLVATSPESTKIQLTWEPPPDDTLNGVPKGYEVKYGLVMASDNFAFFIEDPNRKDALIEGLIPYTNYTVSVAFSNENGNGPPAVTQVRTKEGVPDKPRITDCSQIKSTSFVVNWEAPLVDNGILKNYQLQWVTNQTYKTRIITGHLTQPMSAHITGLEPYTEYQLRVRAETGGGFSDFSDSYPVITDVDSASAATITNVTVVSPTSVFIQWLPPQKFYKKIDSYLINYSTKGAETLQKNVMLPGTDSKKLITDLPTNNDLKFKVAAITQSIFSTSYYVGDFSEEVMVTLEDPTEVTQMARVETTSNAGMIAGIVVGVIFVMLIVVAVIGYRSMTCRKYTRSLYYLAVPTNSQSPQSTVDFPPDTIEEDTKYPEIKVSDFLRHNRAMHANSDDGFAAEFEDISSRTRTDLLAEASYLPENKNKNRYVNISAFDHSRVVLQAVPGRPKSADYVNANFVDGYNKPHAYIATQGPLPHTFADFWRMIWEQGSIVIIMITNLIERGKRKCDMYWPEEGSETYGHVTVKHINTFSRAHYTVRMFSLKNTKNKKQRNVSERIVYQYHYTEWPDHGVPEFTLPVLKFIQKSSSENPPGAGPIVIHCSAGVGRTGTYILIEAMIKQIKDKGTVNIPKFLLHIRQQRNFLVQTEEQYMLIHDAIAEYIITQGDTEIKEHELSKYISQTTTQLNGEMTSMDIQYNLVTNFSPKQEDMFHALKSVNLCKNRKLDLVPLSVKRVILPMKPGVEGSDYINATYLQGYNKSNEFIVTQHPLEHTQEDFWRMVWDQNSSVVVQLSEVDNDEFKSFWPEKDEPRDIGCFRLTYREDDERKTFKIREFLLQSNQDDYILMTRVITPNSQWPETCQPLHKVFDLVEEVQTLHRQNNIGPVIVVDRYGGVEAATFCGLTAIHDQLEHDKSVNIYQLAKLYHLKRVGCIGTKENYLFLYKAAESLIKEWQERDKQGSPGSIRLHLGSSKRNGALPRSVTLNSKVETDV